MTIFIHIDINISYLYQYMNDNSKIEKKIIVYVDGVFDLFHAGHIEFLKKAKSLGTYLIAGVISDEACQSYKRQPIIDLNNRVIMLENTKIVDKVIKKSPLIISKDFIETHNIDVVVHGDDSKQEEFFKVPIEMGIMKYVSYTQGISTTEIIDKIKNIY